MAEIKLPAMAELENAVAAAAGLTVEQVAAMRQVLKVRDQADGDANSRAYEEQSKYGPVLRFDRPNAAPWSFGPRKAQLVVKHIEEVRRFAKKHNGKNGK